MGMMYGTNGSMRYGANGVRYGMDGMGGTIVVVALMGIIPLILVWLMLYFVIKWAVKNGVKESKKK